MQNTNKKKISRFLIHGGANAPVIVHSDQSKSQNDRIRFGELTGKMIIIDRTNLPLPHGKFGKLIVHTSDKENSTKSALCFESDIPHFLSSVIGVKGGMFCNKKYEIIEGGNIEWK